MHFFCWYIQDKYVDNYKYLYWQQLPCFISLLLFRFRPELDQYMQDLLPLLDKEVSEVQEIQDDEFINTSRHVMLKIPKNYSLKTIVSLKLKDSVLTQSLVLYKSLNCSFILVLYVL